MKLKRVCAFILSAAVMMSASVSVCASELVTIDGYKYLSDNGENTLYTGWTTVNGLHRYYKDGKRCLGWHKINENWYYLTRNGGRARGLYQIGDTLYEFDWNGKYIGKASDVKEWAAESDVRDRIYGYAKAGTDPDGNDIYADNFGGYFWNELYLLNDKDIDTYKDLWGGSGEIKYTQTNISYNDLAELYRYVDSNRNTDNSSLWERLDISGLAITNNRVDRTSAPYVKITIDFDFEGADLLRDHLVEKGYPKEMFDFAIVLDYIREPGDEPGEW